MANPVAAWHEEHDYFRRLLELLRKECEALARGGQPNYALMLDIIAYLHEYCDRVHHPREDVAFTLLERYRPEMALPLARLRQEHRVIAHAGETFEKLLAAVLDGATVALGDLETAAATYLVYYGNHIAREEEEVLARAAEFLTPQDWEAVKEAVPAVRDPLYGDRPEERYRNLRRQIIMEA